MTKVRGYSLAESTVVEWLQPFIVTSWAGFDLEDAPDPVRAHVDVDDFGPRAKGGPRSNIKLLIFDDQGALVHEADALPGMRTPEWEESAPRHTIEQVRIALKRLGMGGSKPPLRDVALPGLEEGGSRHAFRVFSGLETQEHDAYDAPFVEVQAIAEGEWDPLGYPEEPVTVDASILEGAFAHVYPPGMMDRAQAGSGTRQPLNSLEGSWTLSPAGSDGLHRYAVLTGATKLVYGGRGRGGFWYQGEFEAVIRYAADDSSAQDLCGVFEGTYPRSAGAVERRAAAQIPFAAVIETVSEEAGR